MEPRQPQTQQSKAIYYRLFLTALSPVLAGFLLFILFVALTDHSPTISTAPVLLGGLLLLTIGLAASLVLARRYLARLMRPINAMVRAMRRVRRGELNARVKTVSPAEMGELEVGFNTMAEDLAHANDELMSQVSEATRELQETLEALEIRNVEVDLARKRAIEANRVKSEFLANMSHEIRTPMNGILGFTELLRKTELSNDQQEFVDTISRSTRSLLTIIDDILDYSKLESGRLVLDHSPFALRDAVESAVALNTPEAHSRGLELVSLVYSDVPERVVGDETRIVQILNNLLSNAVKFTHKGEVVLRVMLEQEDDTRFQVTFSVTDTGIGIPLGQQERMFSAFDQGDLSTKRIFGGTGLGLSIIQTLAEAMQGDVDVSSRPGEGSCFRVSVTLEREPNVPQVIVPTSMNRRALLIEPHNLSRIAIRNQLLELGIMVDELETLPDSHDVDPTRYDLALIGSSATDDAVTETNRVVDVMRDRKVPAICLISSSDQTLMQPIRDRSASYCLSKPARKQAFVDAVMTSLRDTAAVRERFADTSHISQPIRSNSPVSPTPADSPFDGIVCLAADDNPINLKLISALLHGLGVRVLEAGTGAEAVALAHEQAIDIAVLDVHMPEMNGIEAARGIRALHPDRYIPIVALTADAAEQNRREVNRAGIDRLLVKPLLEEDLYAVFAELLKKDYSPAERINATNANDLPARASRLDVPLRDEAQALRIAGGSAAIAERLYRELLIDIPQALSTMRKTFARGDWRELWQLVHRLHGAAAVCGVPRFYQQLGALQLAIRQEDRVETEQRLQAVASEADQLLALHY